LGSWRLSWRSYLPPPSCFWQRLHRGFHQVFLGNRLSHQNDKAKISDVLVAWVPLVLATSGLLITFSTGLWNIGIEANRAGRYLYQLDAAHP
jgi:hypothetical protein